MRRSLLPIHPCGLNILQKWFDDFTIDCYHASLKAEHFMSIYAMKLIWILIVISIFKENVSQFQTHLDIIVGEMVSLACLGVRP